VSFEVGFPSVKPGVRSWEEREAHAKAAGDLIELAPEMAEAILQLVEAYGKDGSIMQEAVREIVLVANKLQAIDKKSEKLVPTLEAPHDHQL
jgi:hypothetical protein